MPNMEPWSQNFICENLTNCKIFNPQKLYAILCFSYTSVAWVNWPESISRRTRVVYAHTMSCIVLRCRSLYYLHNQGLQAWGCENRAIGKMDLYHVVCSHNNASSHNTVASETCLSISYGRIWLVRIYNHGTSCHKSFATQVYISTVRAHMKYPPQLLSQ